MIQLPDNHCFFSCYVKVFFSTSDSEVLVIYIKNFATKESLMYDDSGKWHSEHLPFVYPLLNTKCLYSVLQQSCGVQLFPLLHLSNVESESLLIFQEVIV